MPPPRPTFTFPEKLKSAGQCKRSTALPKRKDAPDLIRGLPVQLSQNADLIPRLTPSRRVSNRPMLLLVRDAVIVTEGLKP